MNKIIAADLIKYNANSRGSNVGDCTARAISLAFNLDYNKARKALNDSAKTNYNWEYNSHDNVIKVIRELGGGGLNCNVERESVNSFADNHPTGTYIIWCTKNGISHTGSHLVTIINGKVYDSWDSRNYMVKGVWTITNGIKGEDITDIASSISEFFHSRNLQEYCYYANDIFSSIINKNRKLKKLAGKYDIAIDLALRTDKIVLKDYTIKYFYTIIVNIAEYAISNKKYEGKLAIAFKPTMTEDQIETHFNTTFYDKMYFFIHNVVDKLEDICEGQELIKDTELPPQYDSWNPFNRAEEKSFNALPYWVKRLTKYFKADSPLHNDYSDRVELEIAMPSFDSEYVPGKSNQDRYFHAYTIDDLKTGLKEYKKTGNYERAYNIAGDY